MYKIEAQYQDYRPIAKETIDLTLVHER
jgi:hypothetical protein